MKITTVTYGLGDDPAVATLYYGQNVLDTLRMLPDKSIQMCATSPPYWGLRDYGGDAPVWEDGWVGHLGLEPTPQMFVDHLVLIFREVRRVLRDDGVLWLNLGDSYFGSGGYAPDAPSNQAGSKQSTTGENSKVTHASLVREKVAAIKPKDLVGIPWMAAFALRADGWYLRSDIIWKKNACMPEPVKDRPTNCHEHVFLLAKSQSYFYDRDAVREPHNLKYVQARKTHNPARGDAIGRADRRGDMALRYDGVPVGNPAGRNLRNVWTINPKGYPGAHFATWPPALVELMIKAGSSEHGCCSACGAPHRRLVEQKVPADPGRSEKSGYMQNKDGILGRAHDAHRRLGQAYQDQLNASPSITVGWQPTCECPEGTDIDHCTVLDPFSGSATTGFVAIQLGRHYIGCDLQPDYLDLAVARLEGRKAPSKSKDDSPDLIGYLFG